MTLDSQRTSAPETRGASALAELVRGRIAAQLSNLSERDRRSLVILLVFLLLIGYYTLLLDPAMTRLERSDTALAEARLRLTNVQRTSRELRSWQADTELFRGYLGTLAHRIVLPSPELDMPEIIAALMAAARDSEVQVVNLRPVSIPNPVPGGEPSTGFTLESNARPESLPTLLRHLWGMRVEELALTNTGEDQRPIRVSARLALLTPQEFARVDPYAVTSPPPESDLVFAFDQDPFAPRRPESSTVAVRSEPEPVRTEPEPAAPPAPTTLDTSGLKIVGISQVRGERLGIIEDSADGRRIFARTGGRVREYIVESIDLAGLVLTDDSGLTARLDLPEAPEWQAALPTRDEEPEPEPTAPSGPARMGIALTEPTSADLTRLGLETASGLLVTSPRRDFPELRVDDLILSINGIAVSSLRTASQILAAVEPGSELDLEVQRDGAIRSIRFPTLEGAAQ